MDDKQLVDFANIITGLLKERIGALSALEAARPAYEDSYKSYAELVTAVEDVNNRISAAFAELRTALEAR